MTQRALQLHHATANDTDRKIRHYENALRHKQKISEARTGTKGCDLLSGMQTKTPVEAISDKAIRVSPHS